MRLVSMMLLWAVSAVAEDAREIVRRAIEAEEANSLAARSYTFVERVEERSLDSKGRQKKREIETFDVTLSEGSPYRRLIARNDKPLSARQEREQEEKLRREIEKRRNESPKEREKRLAQADRRRREERELAREVLDAFDFRLAGEREVGGRPAWVIEAAPRPGYRPKGGPSKILPKVRGAFLVDKQDSTWSGIDAEFIDTVSWGLFLVRLHRGTRFAIERTKVNEEVWLPRLVRSTASARLGLVKRYNLDWEITYRDFRKFHTDSRIVATELPE